MRAESLRPDDAAALMRRDCARAYAQRMNRVLDHIDAHLDPARGTFQCRIFVPIKGDRGATTGNC